MTKCVIWHNPKCGKSRETLRLLQEKGFTPEICEYLKTPPSQIELKDALKKLGISARDLIRKKEEEFKKLGLADPSLPESKLIEAMAKHPVLIERPIVFYKNKAALGRPPENVQTIL